MKYRTIVADPPWPHERTGLTFTDENGVFLSHTVPYLKDGRKPMPSPASNTPSEPRWLCAEHGHVLTGEWKANVEISVVHFCHVCGRELFRDDLLGEIERGGRQPITFEEYVEAQGGL